jgi:hypothetical protein
MIGSNPNASTRSSAQGRRHHALHLHDVRPYFPDALLAFADEVSPAVRVK